MKTTSILGYAFLHAAGAVAYISLVAFVMTRGEEFIKPIEATVLGPVMFLTLFVLSAAVMGLTLFGRPILWYLDGKKKEAVQLALHTVLFLALIFLAIFSFVLAVGGEVFGSAL
jgi:hypothetical protein